jgi:hypothetical protein
MNKSRKHDGRVPSGAQQTGLPQQLFYSPIHLRVVRLSDRPASDEDHVLPGHHEGQSCPRCLTQQPLDPVANYGFPNPLAHGETEPTVLQSIGKRTQHQKKMRPGTSLPPHTTELLTVLQPVSPIHDAATGTIVRTRGSSDSQSLSAFLAARFEHPATTRGAHTGTEAVSPLPFSLLGLISTFGHTAPLLCLWDSSKHYYSFFESLLSNGFNLTCSGMVHAHTAAHIPVVPSVALRMVTPSPRGQGMAHPESDSPAAPSTGRRTLSARERSTEVKRTGGCQPGARGYAMRGHVQAKVAHRGVEPLPPP